MDDAILAGVCFLTCCNTLLVFVSVCTLDYPINGSGVRIIGWLEMVRCNNNREIRTIGGGGELEKLKRIILLVKPREGGNFNRRMTGVCHLICEVAP